MQIVPIVEGHGEVQAVPILLRRILQELGRTEVQVLKPFRVPRNRITDPLQLQRAIRLACAKADEPAVLLLLDAHEDCPAELAPRLAQMASQAAPGIRMGVVLAKSEYEAWFLASLEDLRGKRGVRDDASAPPNPEDIQGAKEYLQRQLKRGYTYSETVDQPAFTGHLNLQRTRQRSPSFDKLWREVQRLCAG